MKKLIIALAITMVLATGCTSAPATDTADTYNYNDTSYTHNEGDDYYNEDDYYGEETYDCSQCVYTGIEDYQLEDGFHLMMQICDFSENEAVEKLGTPVDSGYGYNSFEIGTLFGKSGNLAVYSDITDVEYVSWYHTYSTADDASAAECQQIFKDMVRVLEDEMGVTDVHFYSEDEGNGSYNCTYGDHVITVQKSCSSNFVEIYVSVEEK